MHKTVKKYFIPHADNNYHPHILHTKRTIFYGLVFLFCKVIMILFAMSLPITVFTSPDVLAEQARKIFFLTNNLREEKEVKVLNNNDKLVLASTAKAKDMAEKSYFSHTSPDGKLVNNFIKENGYQYEIVGENLAVGFATAEEVMSAWKKSPTHYANLIDKDFFDLGVDLEIGEYKGEITVFVVQHFASPVVLLQEKNIQTTKTNIVKSNPSVSSSSLLESMITSTKQTNEISINQDVLSEKIVKETAKESAEIVGVPFWKNPIQKYEHAKDVSPAKNVFNFSNWLYLVAIIFFSLALGLMIFIEIKIQHHHIIIQSLSLIVFLVVLYIF
ncbi:MAG: CAP domain-containing protein [Candidatus Magasanikiibacteriota bacterium]